MPTHYDLVDVKLPVEKYYCHLCVRIKCCQKEVSLWLQVGPGPHVPPTLLPSHSTFLFLPSRWSCRAQWAWTAPFWPCRTTCSSTTTPSMGAGLAGWNRESRWRTPWNMVSRGACSVTPHLSCFRPPRPSNTRGIKFTGGRFMSTSYLIGMTSPTTSWRNSRGCL